MFEKNFERLTADRFAHFGGIDNTNYVLTYDSGWIFLLKTQLEVNSFSHDFLEVIQELIAYNIEFSHQPCHLSDESYLLINIKQTI